MAVSYAYNNYLTYKQDVPPTLDTLGLPSIHPTSGDYTGQKKPFFRGRRNIKYYTAIPHNINPEANGSSLNSYYGYGPKITRVEGQGNGGNAVDLTQASIDNILNSSTHQYAGVEYENGRGPIFVKVVDPLSVLGGEFTLKVQKRKYNSSTKVYDHVAPTNDKSCVATGGLISDSLG